MAIERRRILVRGMTPQQVTERVQAFDKLYPDEGGSFPVAVSVALDDWLSVEVPLDLPLAEFLNLAKWMEGDAVTASAGDVVVLSHGDGPDAFWLVPQPPPGPDWFLTGSAAAGTPFQWDCVGRRTVDDPRLQRAPMGARLALMTRRVPAGLHAPDATLPQHAVVTLHLATPRVESLELPEPGRLADTFARSPTPGDEGGGLGQVLDFVAKLFRRG
jgi:hypothetical protein